MELLQNGITKYILILLLMLFLGDVINRFLLFMSFVPCYYLTRDLLGTMPLFKENIFLLLVVAGGIFVIVLVFFGDTPFIPIVLGATGIIMVGIELKTILEINTGEEMGLWSVLNFGFWRTVLQDTSLKTGGGV